MNNSQTPEDHLRWVEARIAGLGSGRDSCLATLLTQGTFLVFPRVLCMPCSVFSPIHRGTRPSAVAVLSSAIGAQCTVRLLSPLGSSCSCLNLSQKLHQLCRQANPKSEGLGSEFPSSQQAAFLPAIVHNCGDC